MSAPLKAGLVIMVAKCMGSVKAGFEAKLQLAHKV